MLHFSPRPEKKRGLFFKLNKERPLPTHHVLAAHRQGYWVTTLHIYIYIFFFLTAQSSVLLRPLAVNSCVGQCVQCPSGKSRKWQRHPHATCRLAKSGPSAVPYSACMSASTPKWGKFNSVSTSIYIYRYIYMGNGWVTLKTLSMCSWDVLGSPC